MGLDCLHGRDLQAVVFVHRHALRYQRRQIDLGISPAVEVGQDRVDILRLGRAAGIVNGNSQGNVPAMHPAAIDGAMHIAAQAHHPRQQRTSFLGVDGDGVSEGAPHLAGGGATFGARQAGIHAERADAGIDIEARPNLETLEQFASVVVCDHGVRTGGLAVAERLKRQHVEAVTGVDAGGGGRPDGHERAKDGDNQHERDSMEQTHVHPFHE